MSLSSFAFLHKVMLSSDEFKRAADYVDGIKSALVGIAANKSIASSNAVMIDDLVKW